MPFFIQLCKTLGKPVNFVPVIDKDVRRWWRSDSLWQAHDARYTADQVCIIPGTAAVAGITRVDEPVGELLDRFEKAAVDQVLASGAAARAGGIPAAGSHRRGRPAGRRAGFAGRAVGRSHRDQPGAPHRPRRRTWQVHAIAGERSDTGISSATNHSTGARLEVVGSDRVVLSVPLSGTWIDIAFTLPATVVDGGAPVVTRRGRRRRDARGAGHRRRSRRPGRAARRWAAPTTVTVEWDPERVADHTGVTATFGAPLAPTLSVVPDALVGRCWPAVFAAIGGAVTDTGFPVVEGLLSLVHLDHAAQLLKPLPRDRAELTVTATASVATDTEVGRVVPVTVNVTDANGIDPGRARGALRDPRPHRSRPS